ncbi:MAG TPA: hypothetical protein DIC42_02790 [Holosporales bacterium]|nr:hypothetical protein [Holosporales bacterium]
MNLFHEQNNFHNLNRKEPPHPLIQAAIRTICERLKWFKQPFEKILILGPCRDLLKKESISLKDASTQYASTFEEYNCIISFFDLQTVNDVPTYLSKIKTHLTPGGFFTAVFMGGESFLNLKNELMEVEILHKSDVSLRVHPTIHIADGAALMQHAGFACPMADIEHYMYKYESLYTLIKELRLWAATSHFYETPKIIQKSCARYIIENKKTFEEKIDLIYLTGLKQPSGEKILETTKASINILETPTRD